MHCNEWWRREWKCKYHQLHPSHLQGRSRRSRYSTSALYTGWWGMRTHPPYWRMWPMWRSAQRGSPPLTRPCWGEYPTVGGSLGGGRTSAPPSHSWYPWRTWYWRTPPWTQPDLRGVHTLNCTPDPGRGINPRGFRRFPPGTAASNWPLGITYGQPLGSTWRSSRPWMRRFATFTPLP